MSTCVSTYEIERSQELSSETAPWTLSFLVQSLRKNLSWQPGWQEFHPSLTKHDYATFVLLESPEAVCLSELDLRSSPGAGGPGS